MPTSTDPTVTLFADLVTREDRAINMPAAALALARIQYRNLDVAPHLDVLAGMTERAARELRGVAEDDRIVRLNGVMFETLGFRGNRAAYYDPRNSFLNDVLERRLGIPITLSLIYIELAAAAGIVIQGVGFPGHFLVRDAATDTLLDPFEGGRALDDESLRALLVVQGIETWDDDFVRPVSRRDMLRRMINNLARYYAQVRDGASLGLLESMTEVLDDDGFTGLPRMVQ